MNAMMMTPSPEASSNADAHLRCEERLQWLTRTQQEMSRTLQRVPWLALSALVALPIGLQWGAFAAAAVGGIGLILPVVAFYLIWCHQQEYASEEATLRRNLLVFAGSVPATTAVAWRVPGKLTQL